ncbi:MAG: glucose-1-phosphate adenylyltransferase [Proteobacteria bacterium]|nr:glucose-1-phosphate adenylyltransferase [Pseudomonadota bacterium]
MKNGSGCLQKKYHFGTGGPSPRFVSGLTKNTYAMVLAGGHNNRLYQLTDHCAKAAVPFGGKFRIIDFVLSNCINSGVRHIGVATQYKSHQLIQHLKRGWSFLNGHFSEFVNLLPAQQRPGDSHRYQGTANAVYQNLDILHEHNPEFVLILSGDHVYKMDYSKLLAFHAENQADMTIACVEVPIADATAYGVIGVNDNSRVVEFAEKPVRPAAIPDQPGKSLVSMGIYVFNTKFLFEQLILDAEDPCSSHDFGKDLIPRLVENYRVFAQNFEHSCVGIHNLPYWRDIRSIDSYWEANLGLSNVTPDLNIYDHEWPIWTRHEQSPPAKFVYDEEGMRGMAVDSLVSGGCIVCGSAVRRSLLFYDVRVDCFSNIEDSVLLPDVNVGRHVTLKKVIVDRNCRIPDGLEVGINPDEDRKHFYVSPKGVTLITSEALGQNALSFY